MIKERGGYFTVFEYLLHEIHSPRLNEIVGVMNFRRGPEIKHGRVEQGAAEREFDHGFAVHHEIVVTFENEQLGSEVGCAAFLR
jgi:hypothetical protein